MSGAIVAMGGGGFSEESRETARAYRLERGPDGAAVEQPLPTRYLR